MEKLLFLSCLVLATASPILTDQFKVKPGTFDGEESFKISLTLTSDNHFEVYIEGTQCAITLKFENVADYARDRIRAILRNNMLLPYDTTCPPPLLGPLRNLHVDVIAQVTEDNPENAEVIVNCKENNNVGIFQANVRLSGETNYFHMRNLGRTLDETASYYCTRVLSLRKSMEKAVFEETSFPTLPMGRGRDT